jgi:hypothetical protein
MQLTSVAFSAAAGGVGGIFTAVVVRGLAPVRHRSILDWLITIGAAGVAYSVFVKGADEASPTAGSWVGSTVGMAYMVGGTPLTSMLHFA